ncbi:MAG TPA: hypothetical protein PLN31_19490 [Azoarcus taiwanensis]|nr:hypothetical protein [Rhodocyclaceae bacterium]HRQ59606.1 hypothetical protein [Azoarcus taiwanensis]
MSADPVVVVKMTHVRNARMCSRGARAFFLRHGLDWDRFLREGLPAEQIEATRDAMALKVVEVARGRQQ